MGTICQTCGAKTVRYTHALNPVLARGLLALHKAGGGPARVVNLPLTRSEMDNFQKLRYFGLVRSPERGLWELTGAGREFIAGRRRAPSHVTTYRGSVVERSDDRIWIHEIPSLPADTYRVAGPGR